MRRGIYGDSCGGGLSMNTSFIFNRLCGGGMSESMPLDGREPRKKHSTSAPAPATTPQPQFQPILQPPPRATITIFTDVGDEENSMSDSELHLQGGANAGSLSMMTQRRPSTAEGPNGNSSRKILHQTRTCLTPLYYNTLHGRGTTLSTGSFSYDPPRSASPASQQPFDRHNSPSPANSAPDLLGHTRMPPLIARSPQRATGSLVSATPIVPIIPYAGEEDRKRTATVFERRVTEVANSGATTTAAAAPARLEDHKGEKERQKQEKKAEKQRKKDAKAQAKLPPKAAREQMIRVGAERLQQRLNELQLVGHRVKNDGNCQFRSISQQLFGSEEYHDLIRNHVISYMKRVRATHFDFYFENTEQADVYLHNMAKVGTWGDELTLRAASDSLYINIHILSSEERNCYITYRPSTDAPPAPTFLVDVAKVRERRRAERKYHRSLHHPLAPQDMDAHDDPHQTHSYPDQSRHQHSNSSGALPSISSTQQLTPAPAGNSNGAPCTNASSSNGGVVASTASRHGGNNDDAGTETDSIDEDIDASALQHALQKRLSRARITSCGPYFTTGSTFVDSSSSSFPGGHGAVAAGDAGRGVGSQHGQSYSLGSGSVGCVESVVSPNVISTPPEVQTLFSTLTKTPQDPPSHSLSPEIDPSVTAVAEAAVETSSLLPPLPSVDMRRLNGSTGDEDDVLLNNSMVAKFKAAGAELEAEVGGSVTILRQRIDPDMDRGPVQQQPPPARLLRPAYLRGATDTLGGAQVPETNASFPVFPTVEGGSVMLLASSTSEGNSLKQSFANLSFAMGAGAQSFGASHNASAQSYGDSNIFGTPSNSRGGGGGAGSAAAATTADDDQTGGDVCFLFEKRTEPIDVFLSYLYPVHYNALSVLEPKEDGGAGAADSSDRTTTASQGQYISAPFLRCTTSVVDNTPRSASFGL